MATLTDADIKRPSQREYITSLEDTDVFVVEDVSEQKIKPITKTNAKATLGITDAEGTLADHETRLDTLEGDDATEGSVAKTVKDAVEPIETRLDTTELALAQQGQDLASVKQTLQQGNGATLDFSDIGIVPLDARATGRANPTVEGRTATNLVENGDFSQGTVGLQSVYSLLLVTDKILTCTGNGNNNTFGINKAVYSIGSTIFQMARIRVKQSGCERIMIRTSDGSVIKTIDSPVADQWYILRVSGVTTDNSLQIYATFADAATALGKVMEVDGNYGVTAINLTSIYGSGNEPSEADCAKIFSYFDGTKSIQLPAKVWSVSEDESETSTLYIADNEELRSVPAISDEVKVVNGLLVKVGNVAVGALSAEKVTNGTFDSDTAWTKGVGWSIAGGVAVSDGSQTAESDLTQDCLIFGRLVKTTFSMTVSSGNVRVYYAGAGGGSRIFTTSGTYTNYGIVAVDGVIYFRASVDFVGTIDNVSVKEIATTEGTPKAILATTQDQVSDDGINGFYQLATPIITPLLTSGILQAKQKGTVYYEPYYEGSHQTNTSRQITLPYEGTIEAVYGYDEDLVEYILDSSEYSLTGTTLTITDALENEVFFVQMSRAEPLAPEMSVNVLNNDRVLLNPTNGKFYDYTIGVSGADGALIPEFIFTEVE